MKLSINVPTELNELTLGQYQKFIKVQKDNGDGIFVAQKMIEIFCGIDLKDTSDKNFNKINDLLLEHKVIFFVLRLSKSTQFQNIRLYEAQ